MKRFAFGILLVVAVAAFMLGIVGLWLAYSIVTSKLFWLLVAVCGAVLVWRLFRKREVL